MEEKNNRLEDIIKSAVNEWINEAQSRSEYLTWRRKKCDVERHKIIG